MNRNIIALVFSIFTIQSSFAQEKIPEYGKMSYNDMNYTSSSEGETDDAVVLFDKGTSRFVTQDNGFELMFERETRIKIQTEAGIKLAEIEIPVYKGKDDLEKVTDFEAKVYNMVNGVITSTSFNDKNKNTEKINDNWENIKIALPNVKVGSVIEYHYKINSPYLFNLRNWEFQWKVPVVYSSYTVRMIPFYQYEWLLRNAKKFDFQSSNEDEGLERQFGSVKYKDMIHTYVMKNVPPFKDEEFIVSPSDCLIKIDFQLSRVIHPDGFKQDVVTTWEALSKEIISDNDFGKYINSSEKLAAKNFKSALPATADEQTKLDSVLNFVKRTYKWNKFHRITASKDAKTFIFDKFGNSAEINLFTVGILRSLGIQAFPVLLSTRDKGRIDKSYPFINQFNTVAIYSIINGKGILSDATDYLLPNYLIPINCRNDQGFIVQKDKNEWIGLETNSVSREKTTILIDLNTKDKYNTSVQVSATDYFGRHYRSVWGDKKTDILQDLKRNKYDVDDSTITVENNDDVNKAYLVKYKINYTPETINDKIYISPFLSEAITTNPLKQKKRTFPVDIVYAKNHFYVCVVKMPEGYKVDYTPTIFNINNDQFELNYKTTTSENGDLTIVFYYAFKQPVYQAADYLKIKFYYNEIINAVNEKIVLVKKQ